MFFSLAKWLINSDTFLIAYTFIPVTIEASDAFSYGTYIFSKPISLAFKVIDKIPCTEQTSPDKDNSPIKILLLKSPENWLLAHSIDKKIGKSYKDPVFLIAAGAKFTVILATGNSKPEFFIADRTRFLDSFTAISGIPTISHIGIPRDTSDSIFTTKAFIPFIPILYKFETMFTTPKS